MCQKAKSPFPGAIILDSSVSQPWSLEEELLWIMDRPEAFKDKMP